VNIFKYAETKLEQDKNFFFEDKFEIKSEIHLANLKEYNFQRFDNSKELIYFRFELDGLYYNKYSLVYKKLPEVLAQLIGIMQPLMIVFSFVIEYFTRYNLDNFLIENFLCYFTTEQNKDDKIIWKNKNYKNFKNTFKNINYSKVATNSNKVFKNLSQLDDEIFNDKLYNSVGISKKQKVNFNSINDCNKNNQLFNDVNNKINIESINVNDDINKIITDKNLDYGTYPLKTIVNSSQNFKKKKEKKGKMIDLFSFSLKNKSKFPYIGFIEYYFPILISSKNKNYNLILNHTKIVKHFSNEILKKLDLFYFLKLVRTTEILKNTLLRKKIKKESLKFLLKSIYFIRDCDIEFIVEEIQKNQIK